MAEQTTRYAILRDGASWEGVTTAGLEASAGGALALAPDAPATGGLLEVGPVPLDAGEQSAWERVLVEAEAPEGTAVVVELFARAEPTPPDAEAGWKVLPTLDALVPPAEEWGGGAGQSDGPRYLWIRVRLKGDGGGASPRLLQVTASTAGESYLDHLPAFYRRDEETRRFLERWLALFRAELGGLESALARMPRSFEPALADEEYLPWLSGWLGFELPHGRGAEFSRGLLRRASRLYARRGTPAGLAEFVELYTGARPRIVEAFAGRKIWQLGVTSALGADTVLPAASLGGMVVPDTAKKPTVGEVIVGESVPLPRAEFGEPLFEEEAHRFVVVLPADAADDALRRAVARVVEAEKPAHTEYLLCVEGEEQEEQSESELRDGATRPAAEAFKSAESAAPAEPAEPVAGVADAETPDADGPRVEDEGRTVEGEDGHAADESPRAVDAGLYVEAVEVLDARNRVVGTLGQDAAEARFDLSRNVSAVRVRFSRPVDLNSVVTGGEREDPSRFSLLVQASWSRRAEKYLPGAVYLDSSDPRAVRFVPANTSGELRTGSYTVTLYGGGGSAGARPAVTAMDGQALRGAAGGENFVFRFQITA